MKGRTPRMTTLRPAHLVATIVSPLVVVLLIYACGSSDGGYTTNASPEVIPAGYAKACYNNASGYRECVLVKDPAYWRCIDGMGEVNPTPLP